MTSGSVIASLRRMGQDLPRLCEQLARIMVAQREDRQPAREARIRSSGCTNAVEALAAAGQAADMMAAALAQAGQAPSELRNPSFLIATRG